MLKFFFGKKKKKFCLKNQLPESCRPFLVSSLGDDVELLICRQFFVDVKTSLASFDRFGVQLLLFTFPLQLLPVKKKEKKHFYFWEFCFYDCCRLRGWGDLNNGQSGNIRKGNIYMSVITCLGFRCLYLLFV